MSNNHDMYSMYMRMSLSVFSVLSLHVLPFYHDRGRQMKIKVEKFRINVPKTVQNGY